MSITPAERREMPKAYDPHLVEGRLYRFWMEQGYFAGKIDWNKKPFCIIMPPPNVTGELHLGHALTATIEDILIRWHRMRGEPTLWLPGVDHAGIATQNVVERELAKEGLTRHDLGRERFLERVWEWVHKYRHVITEQHMRLGASADWTRETFTLDAGPARAVRTTFKRLYDDGLLYKGERIINWCPRCLTALSDLEVDHEEEQGSLWHVRYPVIDERGREAGEFITIATTRPETIVADVAVAVHPEDERYKGFVGKKARLPIIGRELQIIADTAIDPAFGTGALKVTPGHDPVDFEIGERHRLPTVNAINLDATMNEEAGPYAGMDRFRCREQIVEDLRQGGYLVREEPYTHAIGHCSRCNTIVEPLISTQWFVKTKPLAEPAAQVVRDGRIRIVPERFTKIYLNWLDNIRDWCISRQLWWGHRIPVWYCQDCDSVIVEIEDPQRCPACSSDRLEQDPDVLDTWFSSGLWPFSTLGWPEDTEDLRYWYPTSVMETGYDIIFFWVARMIMLGLYDTGQIPFETVYLHGLVRDAKGEKMSKSKGNTLDPLDVIDKWGTDATRFTLATGSSPGNDMRLSEQKLEAGRNFVNKLWNIGRYVITALDGHKVGPLPSDRRSTMPVEDRWILSRLNRLVETVQTLLTDFQLGEAGRQVQEFLWSEYADWYIEMTKVRLRHGDQTPLAVLAHALDTTLRLLHPYMPFVTEELWQNLVEYRSDRPAEALIVAPWPQADPTWLDEAAEQSAEALMEVIRSIRNIRAEKGVEPARFVEAYIVTNGLQETVRASAEIIEFLARARPLRIISTAEEAPREAVVTAVLPDAQVILPMASLFDVEVERQRLGKQIAEAEAEVERQRAKLANPAFRDKAPAAVVQREEERLAAAQARLNGLRARLTELGSPGFRS